MDERLKTMLSILGEHAVGQIGPALASSDPKLHWAELLQELMAATTPDQCFAVFQRTPSNSPIQLLALEMASLLATTVEQCRHVFQVAPPHSVPAYEAIRKIDALLTAQEGSGS